MLKLLLCPQVGDSGSCESPPREVSKRPTDTAYRGARLDNIPLPTDWLSSPMSLLRLPKQNTTDRVLEQQKLIFLQSGG